MFEKWICGRLMCFLYLEPTTHIHGKIQDFFSKSLEKRSNAFEYQETLIPTLKAGFLT